MPSYESYKDSGVEWLGEIPSHWQVVPLKYALSLASEKVITRQSNLKYIGMENVESFTGRFIETASEVEGMANRFLAGDILFGKLRPYLSKVALTEVEGLCSTEFLVYRARQGSSKYFRYLMTSSSFIDLVNASTYGSKMPRASADFIGIQRIPIPTKQEQTAIAAFLDRKTAQIEQAVNIKERQITLLKERKQILIQNAVTRGLNSDAPMRDSGVEWIGHVPKHWKFAKLKHHIDMLPGFAFKSSLYSSNSEDIKLLRGVNVNPGNTDWGEVVYWPKKEAADYSKYNLAKGDLVMAMDRPWISSGIRLSLIDEEDLPCLLLQRVVRIRGKSGVCTKYVSNTLSSNIFLSYFEPMLTGISVPHISTDQIGNFSCPVPPYDEQLEILDYIETESAKLDKGITLLEQQITKLKEYKATLINSAVTGKIKVPGVGEPARREEKVA
ncbi:restriction modification system DNA specificity domain protein [Nitrosococcus halophilus Nc 4]|uniref:Restriction modification system DNA specificity domain protein n=2 Tax=Nitrosococcus halophilus TaxID=133539 RepID=D5BXH4_NITHN|nr:restriction modification system DNA specificity domain protein [Nitrosococcus halophilus Nc 4]